MSEQIIIPKQAEQLASGYKPEDRKMILMACGQCCEALKDMVRGNNHPFVEHPLGVAQIVANDMGLGADAVAAVFIHEATRFHSELRPFMDGKYSQDVLDMADGLNRISSIRPKDTGLQAENYRKLIISYSKDPRVTLIKLADRLEVMRNIDLLPKSSRMQKTTETAMLYVPLAHKLGLYRMNSELEDLIFKYTEPEQYREITNSLKATQKDRDELVSRFVMPLRDKLNAEGIKYSLKVRTKTAYSIWKKMQAQQVPFEGVFDVFAIRFIIDSPPEKEKELCWKVYSLVTEEYRPDTNRLRDWITKPKANGYESLHTTVSDKEGRAIEVQIRTVRMDDIAERGNASHWAYKGIGSDGAADSWLGNVRRMLESPDSRQETTALDEFKFDEIFVFTPTEDLRRLPAGATVLDFAFEIHSNLGLKCSGGMVNGKIVPIREQLHTGDVVEIITNKNQKPSSDWLNFVVTGKARSKIKQRLREVEFKLAADGKEMLDRRLKNSKLELPDEMLNRITKKFNYKTINEFYAAVGDGTIDFAAVKDYILAGPEGPKLPVLDEKATESAKGGSGEYLIIGGGLSGVDYKLAKCCNPVYGDKVFGFVTVNGGIKIHRMSCPNAARLIENYPYRIQKVKWRENVTSTTFQTGIRVLISDYAVGDKVLASISSFNVSVRSFKISQSLKKDESGLLAVTSTIAVPSNKELDKVIQTLKKIHGVSSVNRTSNIDS
jgi:guanosine-3',5'-bis(diphosphate) 3'-pyrophosphohydrolase